MIESRGIKLLPGVVGPADAAVEAYLERRLEYDPDTSCKEHDRECHCH